MRLNWRKEKRRKFVGWNWGNGRTPRKTPKSWHGPPESTLSRHRDSNSGPKVGTDEWSNYSYAVGTANGRFVQYVTGATICIKYPQLVSVTGPGLGMRCDEVPLLKICEYQGCRPTTPDAPLQGRMKRKERECMRCVWRTGGMKFVAEENWRNPEKTYPHSLSSTKKLIWRDRDVILEPQRWEACVYKRKRFM